jgi:triose/dihydroxyacetone kinase / FAD-AMP lyase (cyclizing)
MPGISLTLLKINEKNSVELLDSLDAPTASPIWPKENGKVDPKKDQITPMFEEYNSVSYELKETEDSKFFKSVLKAMSEVAISKKDFLNDLDSKCGDGDMGSNFARGGEFVFKAIDILPLHDVAASIYEIALLIQQIGGTSGVVFSYFLLKMSETFKKESKSDPETWLKAFKNATISLEKFSGAKKGDRTFMDTIIPAVEEFEKLLKDKLTVDIVKSIEKAANEGAISTKDIVPKRGRATYLGDRVKGVEDPGSRAIALLFTCWMEQYTGTK